MQDSIEYEVLVQNALRNVIRDILADVAKNGRLPGEHHFYISFATQAPGVEISPRLKTRFAESMTIVLQHRFWDMKVAAEYFTVRLSFGGISERLTIPFTAMQSFYDPSSAFEVAFSAAAETAPVAPPAAGEGVLAFPAQNREADKKQQPLPAGSNIFRAPPLSFAKTAAEQNSAADKAAADVSRETEADAASPAAEQQSDRSSAEHFGQDAPAEPDSSASIISLDAFRKK